MCFHSKQTASVVQLKNRFKANFKEESKLEMNDNINGFNHPYTPIITNEEPNEIQLFQWGLIPNWSKDNAIQKNTLNAKIETLTEKPSFKDSITKHCIIPVTGFYEWKWLNSSGTKKEKYLISVSDEEIFSLAGLWNRWTNPTNGQIIHTYTILTMEANELMAEIHNTKKRMPVILTRESEQTWLNSRNLFPEINHNLTAIHLDAPKQMSLF